MSSQDLDVIYTSYVRSALDEESLRFLTPAVISFVKAALIAWGILLSHIEVVVGKNHTQFKYIKTLPGDAVRPIPCPLSPVPCLIACSVIVMSPWD